MSGESANYRPLIVLTAMIVLIASALQAGAAAFDPALFMRHVMGLFFALLAMFKLFDLPGFVKGFAMYDLIAKRSRTYAHVYPFLELALGLLYLSGLYLYGANAATLVLMGVGAAGVIGSIARGMDIRCACLGTALNVPLSTVSLVENLGMAIMAAVMFFMP